MVNYLNKEKHTMFKKTMFVVAVIFIGMQLLSVERSNPQVDDALTLKAPTEVQNILQNSCYDCHSFETKWPWYSNIAPVSFFVANHVDEARKALNFSTWDTIDEEVKVKRLKRAIITVKNEMMPKPTYAMAHEETKLNDNEKKLLIEWFENELGGEGIGIGGIR